MMLSAFPASSYKRSLPVKVTQYQTAAIIMTNEATASISMSLVAQPFRMGIG